MWNPQLQCPIMTKSTVHSNLDGLIINDHVLSDAGLRKNEPLLEHPNSKKLRSQHPGARRTLKKRHQKAILNAGIGSLGSRLKQ
jgi:hypothetical protein